MTGLPGYYIIFDGMRGGGEGAQMGGNELPDCPCSAS